MLFAYTIYLLMASIVHPWYVINLVVLTVFITHYKYAIIWSALVVLSYAAYVSDSYQENYTLLWIEYGLVIGWMGYELLKNKAFRWSYQLSE